MDTNKATQQTAENENLTTDNQETVQTESEKKTKKLSKKTIIIIAAAMALCAIVVLTFTLIIPTIKYNNANKILEQDLYEDAILVFTELGEFKDSAIMIDECGYQEAADLLEAGEYDAAHDKYIEMGEYKDSATMVNESTYQKALNLTENNSYDEAVLLFTELGEYLDSAEMINETNYQRGHYLLEQDEYSDARNTFKKLEDYKDSEDMVNEVLYVKGNDCIEAEDYNNAIASLRGLGAKQYKDSAELLSKAYYAKGSTSHEAGNYSAAFLAYNKIPGYLDVKEKLETLIADTYDAAVTLYCDEENFRGAEKLFELTEDYKSTEDYMTLIMLYECCNYMAAYDLESEYNGAELYEKLRALIAYEHADEIIMNDIWIKYFLEGHWTSGRKYIKLYQTKKYKEENRELINRYVTLSDNLQRSRGDYFKVEDGTLFTGSNDDGWEEQYQITFVDYNTIEVYNFNTKETLTFKRKEGVK